MVQFSGLRSHLEVTVFGRVQLEFQLEGDVPIDAEAKVFSTSGTERNESSEL